MANFIVLRDAADNSEVFVNADQIVSIRRYDGQPYSTLFFADGANQFGVKETPAEIAKKAANTKWT
jgi:hypothetical protein